MNFSELFSLEPRALYIWGAFGAFVLVLALEVFLLRARIHRTAAALRDEQMAASAQSRLESGNKGI
jgi:heme exporter protein D